LYVIDWQKPPSHRLFRSAEPPGRGRRSARWTGSGERAV